MAEKKNISYAAGEHPDINLPDPEYAELGTPFYAAVPAQAPGWIFEGWYTDHLYQNRWIDGTVINSDLELFGKWTKGSVEVEINFEYSSNTEDKSAVLPDAIKWHSNTRIYPQDLPSLPRPTESTVTITGWYLDKGANTLITNDGVFVGDGGLTVYAKAVNSAVVSLSFDYAMGRAADLSADYPMPATAIMAWDAETLDEDSVLPHLMVCNPNEVVELPTADDMPSLYPGTSCEAEFKGWFAEDLAKGLPLTQVSVGNEDMTMYALYEPIKKPEFVNVTYKVAKVYIPTVDDSGQLVPSYDDISVEEAVSLMPSLAPEYLGVDLNEETIENYEWHDMVVKGSEYRLAMPDNTTARTKDYQFAGYFAEETCENELFDVFESLENDLTVYVKFVKKPEVVLSEDPEIPETYNISFAVDGFASDSEVASGGMMPPDLILPDAAAHEPVAIDKKEFPDLIDAYIPEEMPVCDGFKFKNWYYYNESGTKVIFEPGVTEVNMDMVLYPEFEMLQLDKQIPIALVVLTSEIPGAPDKFDWTDVPYLPFEGMTNPIIVQAGSTFDTSTIEFPGLESTFEVEGFYTLANNTLTKFTTGVITEALTLYVRFNSTIDRPLDVMYNNVEDTEEKELIAPAFDYELATAKVSTGVPDGGQGNFGYEPRPADVVSWTDGASKTLAITGYYTDPGYTQVFDPAATTVADETINIYPKAEASSQVMVTVDYVPQTYTLSSSDFTFEIPTAPELPMTDKKTTYLLNKDATGADILTAIGNPPTVEFWKPQTHAYGNCYWYTVASAEDQVPQPFSPAGFKLTEPITLYPQFEADMHYPNIVRRDDLHLTLSEARYGLGAASASSSN